VKEVEEVPMKKTNPLTFLSLLVALPVAAQIVPIGDVAAAREALRPACPVLDLSGAIVGRGLFGSDFDVKIGGRDVGAVKHDGDGYAYSAGGAPQAKIEIAADGSARTATVTGCNGEIVGRVIEVDGSDSARFRVENASGRVIAESGAVDGTSFALSGSGASAKVENAHWALDRYALTSSGIDGRLVLASALMNNDALYRRSAERRRERMGERGERRY